MKDTLFLIVLYGSELFLYFIWYLMVLKKDMTEKRLLYRALRIVYGNWHIILRVFLRMSVLDGSKEITQLKKGWRYICSNAITVVPSFLGIALLSPIFTMLFVTDSIASSNSFSILLPGIIMLGMNWRFLKGYTQKSIKILNEFLRIILFLEDNPTLIKTHTANKFTTVKNRRFIITALSIFIGSCILTYTLYTSLNFVKTEYPVAEVIFFLAVIAYFILSNAYQKLSERNAYRQREKNIEIKYFELEKYQDDIDRLCKKLGITDLAIDIVHESGINAYAMIEKSSRSTINFTDGFITMLRHIAAQKGELAMDETFKAVFCHELIHITYRDPLRIRTRARNGALFALCFLLLSLLGAYGGTFIPWVSVLSVPILILYFCCSGILGDVRYWGQMSELRADKKGMRIAEVSKDVFDTYWEIARNIEYEDIRKINNANLLYRRYKRYMEIEYHPSIERRKQSLQKRINWGIYDYVEQFFLILKWRMTGKGWNGR